MAIEGDLPHQLQFDQIVDRLPADFGALRSDAAFEGKRFIERLHAEWQSGEQRFTQAHEVLLVIRVNRDLAGIGGMTVDPFLPSAMRLRRFFIRPAYRRRFLGRQLAAAILNRTIPSGTTVTVNTDNADAAMFWEALGFQRDPKLSHSHWLIWQGLS
ncbi:MULTISPECIES: GNAT family N-acetyltransferase [Rhizobium]|uniref:GNAT superfamily N-acetyltransferase n=1 Tax=Rhizobium paranaense TaxID=1650438 RepID=A0A7W8XX40_9HYPH|nr:GNAT family N-acetyltransferase [Rhizobium paranaense]MBB5577199.1 GNAT superfamily N-acetyltransferase [Rhizobium paranaense]